jgi:RNA polymerase sigma-70 factor (ECF subfamily)
MADATDTAPLLRAGPVEGPPPPVAASPPAREGEGAHRRGGQDAAAPVGSTAERVRQIVRSHYGALWRWLRRLGIAESSVEDVAQQALVVVARRIDDVEPGREKTFLFGVALRVAQAARREQRRWRDAGDDGALSELPAPGPDAGEELDDRRARAVLDALLESMPLDLRSVFILHEIEEMTMAEIARTLEVPAGTVASRLRRARESFEALSRRVQARRQAPSPGRPR